MLLQFLSFIATADVLSFGFAADISAACIIIDFKLLEEPQEPSGQKYIIDAYCWCYFFPLICVHEKYLGKYCYVLHLMCSIWASHSNKFHKSFLFLFILLIRVQAFPKTCVIIQKHIRNAWWEDSTKRIAIVEFLKWLLFWAQLIPNRNVLIISKWDPQMTSVSWTVG